MRRRVIIARSRRHRQWKKNTRIVFSALTRSPPLCRRLRGPMGDGGQPKDPRAQRHARPQNRGQPHGQAGIASKRWSWPLPANSPKPSARGCANPDWSMDRTGTREKVMRTHRQQYMYAPTFITNQNAPWTPVMIVSCANNVPIRRQRVAVPQTPQAQSITRLRLAPRFCAERKQYMAIAATAAPGTTSRICTGVPGKRSR